jgi:hypothetical protein
MKNLSKSLLSFVFALCLVGVLNAQPVQFSPDAVRVLALKQAEKLAIQHNEYVAHNYRVAVAQWNQNAEILKAIGKPLPAKPVPPQMVLVGYDESGWPAVVKGPMMPAIEDAASAPPAVVGELGKEGAPGIWSVGPKDNAPVGFVLVTAEGKFEKREMASPFGALRYYAKQ